ncbi:MAG: metalloregulator ArsR/SmtB family transcription factor [Natronospirillum sp.]|uniref:ArsR/SmtB family transcription factor n=1 Tax=Natronospirillum sp. TaxID=2812955 RepID=UPI0025E697B3|nr:metalloregulator ArsR/SmtB family transcription factor [Natronospirillum sp.]MCH8553074.1 metalloregulator ArsR/SmtB family transcription factor [Natronospirillum sp.]
MTENQLQSDTPTFGTEAARLFRCLGDSTRLSLMLLIQEQGELCVCELTEALQLSQPKISRHLAQLRQCGLVEDRRQGQWVFYRLPDSLPGWMGRVLAATAAGQARMIEPAIQRLEVMQNRPERCC